MFIKQNLITKFIAITVLAVIGFSCENESLEPEASVENQSFTFHTQDSLNVSQDVAITAALNFGNGSNLIEGGSNLRTTSQEVEIDEVIIVPDEQGEPAIYVINYVGTGYIVLSATLKESPVLGFSDTEHFDVENIPLGMAEWFYDRMNKIQVIKSDSNYQIPEEVYGEWTNVLGKDIESSNSSARVAVTIEQHGPLLSTLWGQWSPYNNLVPTTCSDNSTGRAPTGCVATTIAQVARYHAHGSSYNWSIMPNNSWTGRTTSGDREVAELMRDIGSWIGMDYGCGGSSVNTGDAVSVFRNRLGYSSGGSYQTLSIEGAEPKVKADIKAGRPVIMAGNHGYYT